jgi:hypothetical protein
MLGVHLGARFGNQFQLVMSGNLYRGREDSLASFGNMALAACVAMFGNMTAWMHIPSCLRHGSVSQSRHHRAGCYIIPTTHYMSVAGTSRPSTFLSSDRDRGWMTSESTPPIIFQRPEWRTNGLVRLLAHA